VRVPTAKITWVFFAVLAGCVTPEEKGDCLDWEVLELVQEKCIPLYGNLICTEQVVHRYHCILRDDTQSGVLS
jgi:hypothetical protein